MYVNHDPPEPRSVADLSNYERAKLTGEVNKRFKEAFFSKRTPQAQKEFVEWTRAHLRAKEMRIVSTGGSGVMLELLAESAPTIAVSSKGEAMFWFKDGQHRAEGIKEPQYRVVPVVRSGRRKRTRRR